MKKIKLTVFLLLSVISAAFAQFEDGFGNPTGDGEYVNFMRRIGRTGIGLYPGNTLPTSLLQVRASGANSQISHVEQGSFGTFASGSQWLGLGVAGTGTAYGLGIADDANVGVYNLLEEGTRTNLIAGFGETATTNDNRFIVRGFSGSTLASKDLVIVNPRGTVSINSEPQQSLPDLSTALYVDGRDGATDARFRSIFIQNDTKTGGANFESFSAMGEEGNTAVINTPVEGFRAQFTNNAATNVFSVGTAVNLQVFRNPTPAVPPVVDVTAFSLGGEAAELYWQDLGYSGPASTDPLVLAPGTAQSIDKFFISFRNADPGGPFVAGNRLPVMQFQSNGRVGIGQAAGASPISSSGLTPIFLDVAAGIFATAGFIGSDRRLKKDIQPVDNAMDLVRRLQGTTYVFRTDEFPGKNLPMGRQYGFIAQDLEKVIPEVAQQCDNGFYAVNYDAIIPILTEAMKEQDAVISALQTELSELRSTVADLKADRAGQNTEGFRLEQNAPNPFSNSTVIGYALPSGTNGAVISVYDLTGRTLRSFNLSDGEGQITLNAGDLPEGLYIYDLQVNGRQVLERKMSVARK